MTAPRKFVVTHEIMMTGPTGTLTIPVMYVGGDLVQRGEWERKAPALWQFLDGQLFGPTTGATLKRLGRGSDPRRGARASKRVVVNLTPEEHKRCKEAAATEGRKLPVWAKAALDAALERGPVR